MMKIKYLLLFLIIGNVLFKAQINNVEKNIKFAFQYKEVLTEGKIEFIPEIIQIENLEAVLQYNKTQLDLQYLNF